MAATDWIVVSASNIKVFRDKPYMRIARMRLASTADVYPSGGVGIAPPPAGSFGFRKGVQFINVISLVGTPSGAGTGFVWGWDAKLRTLRAYGMHATTSIVPATLVEAASGTDMSGTILYMQAYGR